MRKLNSLVAHALLSLPIWLLRALSHVIPRDHRQWVVGSWDGRRFADNSKWFFLWTVRNQMALPGVRVTWLTKSAQVAEELETMGLPVVRLHSPRGWWRALRAKIHVIDADSRGTSFALSGGAITVNLFHGIALKHIGEDIAVPGHHLSAGASRFSPRRTIAHVLAPWLFERYDYVIASSPANAEVMTSAFRPRHATWVTGLTRNDVLKGSDSQLERWFGVKEGSQASTAKRAILYMPTFRDSKRVGRSIPLDLPRLDEALEAMGLEFAMKLHPHDAAAVPDLSRLRNIHLLDARMDPYLILRNCAGLITDYSSVFFDCLLTDIPLFFFAYDIETYLSADRGMYYDYRTLVPGPIVRSSDELIEALEQRFLHFEDRYEGRRKALLRQFHHLEERPASELVARHIAALANA